MENECMSNLDKNTSDSNNIGRSIAERRENGIKMGSKDVSIKPVFFPPDEETPCQETPGHVSTAPLTPSSVMTDADGRHGTADADRRHGMTDADRRRVRRKQYSKTWTEAWRDFCQNTTVHGLRQITETQPYLIRRFIWLVLVLTGLALFLYQMISGILYFYTYPVSVNVKINYNDTIRFPALTICNQNAFRKTVSAEEGWYYLLSDMFSSTYPRDVDLTSYNATHLQLYDIYNVAGHSKDDLFVRCVWDSHPCSVDDFVTTMTDYGKCYTFNGNHTSPRIATRTGTEGGLQLLINLEQYEYMPGPNQGAGLRLHVHSQYEAPLVRDFGIAVPPGSYSLLGITMLRIENLPHPHGQCDTERNLQHYDVYSKTNCLEECKQQYLEKHCVCKHINMVNDTETPYCTLAEYQSCAFDSLKQFNVDRSECDCAIPCEMESLEMFNSIGEISGFDALNLLNSPMTPVLQERYVKAREITQRVNGKIIANDNQMISAFRSTTEKLESTLEQIHAAVDYLEDNIEELFSVLDQRITFHQVKGLEKVKYIMEHDFVRGFTIVEERTLPYLSWAVYEVRGTFRRVIDKIKASENGTKQEKLLALVAWESLENIFLERLDVLRRVSDNLTEIHNSYKTGDPLLTYKSSLNRRYDMSWITVELLQAVVNDGDCNQDQFYADTFRRMGQINESIHNYLDMGQKMLETYEIDQQLWADTDWTFRKGCVQYNYNVFLFKDRIVYGPVHTIKDKIAEFDILQRTLISAKESLFLSISLLRNNCRDVRDNSWPVVQGLLADALSYITDTTSTKTKVAEQLTSPAMTNAVNDLELFFSGIRTSGRSLQEKLQYLHMAVADIWENMLSEYSTAKFYDMVHEDFVAFQNDSDFYLPYFANLLDVKTQEIVNITAGELEYRLNADFPVINVEEKLRNLTSSFTKLENWTDTTRILGVHDEEFTTSVSILRESLADFLQESKIGVEFYQENFIQLDVFMQELSYEEILQQPAYDTLNLLGDIGGSIGLFLGASALTAAEILDVFILQMMRLGTMQ